MTPEDLSSCPGEGHSEPSGDRDSCFGEHLANRWQLTPLPQGWQLDWKRNRLPSHPLSPKFSLAGLKANGRRESEQGWAQINCQSCLVPKRVPSQ